MNSLGLYLRGLREAKGMSLDDISRSTRVGRRHLEALEGDIPGELPAPVFVKGFIRAYCEFLECPPDHALDLYRESTGEPAAAHGPIRPLSSTRSRRSGPLVISIVLFVALGLSLLALRVGLQSSRKSSSPPPVAREEMQKVTPPAAPSPAKTPAAAPVVPAAPPATAATSEATSPTTTTSAPQVAASTPPASTSVSTSAPSTSSAATEAKSGNHHLVVRAIEPTWLRVQVDDGQVAEELLQTGAVREWSATKRFTLTVGNAGGVEIDLNGKRLPSLGAKGAVIQRLVLPQEQPGSGS